MSEVSENSEKPSRGEAAPGLSAQLPNDIEIGLILVPKWLQNWSQNGVRKGPKFAFVFGLLLGPKLDPKLVPKRLQNWSQNGVSCPDVLLEPQVGPKMDPKWLRSPKMDPKWLPNGASTASPSWPRRGTVCRCFLDFAAISKTSAGSQHASNMGVIMVQSCAPRGFQNGLKLSIDV